MNGFCKVLAVAVCLWVVSASALHAQIVNIEGSRLEQDSMGWQGSASLNFSYTQNINKLFIIKAGTGLQHRQDKHVVLSLNDLNLVFSSQDKFNFSGFQHFRYNYLLNNWFSPEAYSQGQFDRVQLVKFRYLLGGGGRFRLYKQPKGKLHLGIGGMYEHEREGETGIVHNDFRLSNYLAGTYKPIETFSGTLMVYYQPLPYRFSDYRVSTLLNLFFKFNKYLSFSTGFNMAYDSNPVDRPDVVNLTFSVTQGIMLRF